MKSLILSTLALALTSATSLSVAAAPNMTDYLQKGKAAIQALQEFNFRLQYNIFTTGGAQTTRQAMLEVRQVLRTMAAGGLAASYTEFYDDDSINEMLRYLDQKFPWSRTNYLEFYAAALGSSDCYHKLEYASGKIENALEALQNYTDAKSNNPDPDKIDTARKAFLAQCANNKCVDALRFAT